MELVAPIELRSCGVSCQEFDEPVSSNFLDDFLKEANNNHTYMNDDGIDLPIYW